MRPDLGGLSDEGPRERARFYDDGMGYTRSMDVLGSGDNPL